MANERYGAESRDWRESYGRHDRFRDEYDHNEARDAGRQDYPREPRSFSPGEGDPYGDYGQGYAGDRYQGPGYRSAGFDRQRYARERSGGGTGPIYQNQYGLNRGVDMGNPSFGEGQGGFTSYGHGYGYGAGGGHGGTRAYETDRGYGRGYRGSAGDAYGSNLGYGSGLGDENPMLADIADGATGHHRGRGPKNYIRSDERIREDVNDRLADHPHLDASDIEVTVREGEVTLTGSVDSRHAKRRAEDCADAVSGAKHVQNNLRVKDHHTGNMTGASSSPIKTHS